MGEFLCSRGRYSLKHESHHCLYGMNPTLLVEAHGGIQLKFISLLYPQSL